MLIGTICEESGSAMVGAEIAIIKQTILLRDYVNSINPIYKDYKIIFITITV